MTPAVSVLLPVHNGLPFLREAVESVLAQSFRDFECILINDGSTDGSGPIIDRYASRDSRIVPVHQENRGLVATLNRGLGMARAPLVARMDADDISLPDRFERQFAFLTANAEVAAVGGAITLIDEVGGNLRDAEYPTDPAVVAVRMRGEGSMLAHPAVMMRRDAVLAAGGYREAFRHAEDYDLWLRLLRSWQISNLPDIVLFYRQHSFKVSTRHAFTQTLATAVARQLDRLRCRGLPDPIGQEDRGIDLSILARLGMERCEEARLRMDLLTHLLANPASWADDDTTNAVALSNWLAKHCGEGTDEQRTQRLLFDAAWILLAKHHVGRGGLTLAACIRRDPLSVARAAAGRCHRLVHSLLESHG